ncbi:ATP-dependent DNA helicase RecG [Candidatus Nomurabacteria bacterium]|nr:ATP-dependent DNA helicase RecG [Candidatus Nomurabacteria bacterium]
MNLDSKILDFHLSELQKKALKKLKIEKVRDLLYHFPTRYGDTSQTNFVENLESGMQATLFGRVKNLKTGKTFRSKMSQATGTFYDDTGEIKVAWFNQPYLAKMLNEEKIIRLTGKVSEYNEKLRINNPKVEEVSEIPIGVGNSLFGKDGEQHTLYPVYSESKGLTSNWIYHNIKKIFKNKFFEKIEDPIPIEILEKYNLPKLKTALIWIHSPHKESDALAARKRFAFEEIFYIQLQRQLARKERGQKKSFKIPVDQKEIKKFVDRFPFELTDSQNHAIGDILNDFKSGKPMARLLEGDVGSGKTAVAAATVYAVTNATPNEKQNFGHLQTAYMVPTEILAKQHFQNFITFFEHMHISIGLITSSGCYKFPSKINPKEATKISRTQLLKWVANGEIPILIGTHSLIQKSVKFENLAYVIIDEQHRFGTLQRQKLARKDDFEPHLLSMTATPIPRTLALTIYGDLDLTLLDQMPMGRKPIITELVLPNQREKIYEKIKEEIANGRQIYVICPRIEEPDPTKQTALNVKSVKAEAKRLKEKIFTKQNIAILHSKMKPDEKEKVMKDFEDGKIDILVSTSVVEVGVNVPNATNIIIEGAERFGLSQLHQLRGRVLRSNHQAYAYLFSDTKSDTSIERLKALQTAKNGFELSEFDLKFRGAGELYGKKQWGVSDLGMEAIKNLKMVEAARVEAGNIVEKNTLKNYPNLKSIIDGKTEVHFE